MNAFRNFVKQLSLIWGQAGPAQRAALAAAGVLLAAAIVGVGVWSARPQYVMLASELTPVDAGALIARLESAGIKYRMGYSGSSVQVPQGSYSQAKVAAGELINPDTSRLAPLEGSIIGDPSMRPYQIERQLEASLARTIMTFTGVNKATVHIGRPPDSPFITEQRDVTASVVLELKQNVSYSARQAAGIVALVANGVEGLDPENVTVTDTNGRMLSSSSQGVAGDIAGQLEYRQRVESSLGANAELMLSQLLGFGHAVVRVTADVDFTTSTRNEITFDPEGKVRKTEKIENGETKRLNRPPNGAAGTSTNLGNASPSTEKAETIEKKETINTDYEVGKVNDIVNKAAGTIKRLTIAAVVDLSPLKDKEGAPEITPEQLTGIIKQAVGFDPSRSDEIELLLAPLATASDAVETPVAAPWREYESLVRNASLGIAALVALILGMLILKKVQPGTPTIQSGAALDTRRARAVANMSDAVRRNPEQLKEALRLWLAEDASEPAAETATARAA